MLEDRRPCQVTVLTLIILLSPSYSLVLSLLNLILLYLILLG